MRVVNGDLNRIIPLAAITHWYPYTCIFVALQRSIADYGMVVQDFLTQGFKAHRFGLRMHGFRFFCV